MAAVKCPECKGARKFKRLAKPGVFFIVEGAWYWEDCNKCFGKGVLNNVDENGTFITDESRYRAFV